MPISSLDSFDRRILDTLQRDGRMSNVALAERVGLSPTPTLRRVRRLEQSGVIAGYGATLDRRRIGLGLTAFVSITVAWHNDEARQAFEDAVRDCEEVVACYIVSGDSDFLLEVVVPDLESYSQLLIDTLLKLPGVKDVRSSFAMRMVKAPSALPLELAAD